jgi:hypothetical protein
MVANQITTPIITPNNPIKSFGWGQVGMVDPTLVAKANSTIGITTTTIEEIGIAESGMAKTEAIGETIAIADKAAMGITVVAMAEEENIAAEAMVAATAVAEDINTFFLS